MQNYPRRLTLASWNMMVIHTLKLMCSVTGLLMLMLTILFGGGTISLIMGQVALQGLGYFIVQPVVFTIYGVCVLARYRAGNPYLSVGKEIRNIIINVAMGIAATVLLLIILWFFRFYIPVAGAAEVQPTIMPPADLSSLPVHASPGFFAMFPVMFNMFSIAMFSVLTFTPFVGVIIAALVNCNAPIRHNIGLLFRGLWLNIGTMTLFSAFSFFLMGLWSFGALQQEALIFLSSLPLVFLSVLSYVIAEQIYEPEKHLLGFNNIHKSELKTNFTRK